LAGFVSSFIALKSIRVWDSGTSFRAVDRFPETIRSFGGFAGTGGRFELERSGILGTGKPTGGFSQFNAAGSAGRLTNGVAIGFDG
jgi:hypothetical protein